MAAACRRALGEAEGSLLAFLPGVAEIERTAARLDPLPAMSTCTACTAASIPPPSAPPSPRRRPGGASSSSPPRSRRPA